MGKRSRKTTSINQLHVSVTSEKTSTDRLYLVGEQMKLRPVLGFQAPGCEVKHSQREWGTGEEGEGGSGYLALGFAGVED